MKPLSRSLDKLTLDLRAPVIHLAEIVHERRAIYGGHAL
jgi:hypothetical protein